MCQGGGFYVQSGWLRKGTYLKINTELTGSPLPNPI